MREVYIKLLVTDESDLQFIVTPGNDLQFGQLGAALRGLAYTQELTLRALRTLAEVQETKGANPADIAKTVAGLIEPNRLAAEMVEYVRVLLGKSTLVSSDGPNTKGKLQ